MLNVTPCMAPKMAAMQELDVVSKYSDQMGLLDPTEARHHLSRDIRSWGRVCL